MALSSCEMIEFARVSGATCHHMSLGRLIHKAKRTSVTAPSKHRLDVADCMWLIHAEKVVSEEGNMAFERNFRLLISGTWSPSLLDCIVI